MKPIVFALFLLLFSSFVFAQKIYNFNTVCKQAYQNITSLKLNDGVRLVNEARKQNPNNLIPDLLQSYIDFFILFFNEDPAEYKAKKESLEDRISNLKDGDENSPYYNYCLSVAYLQKAMIAIKFNERFAAFFAFKKAFSFIKDNRKSYPAFLPDNMVYAPMQVLAGIIPDGYKGIAGFLGIKGSVNGGMQLLRNFVNSNDSSARFFFNEAAFYYCYLLFYIQNKPEEAFAFIKQKNLDIVNNHLFAYMAANLALNSKQAEYAKSIILNRNPSPDYMQIPMWNYEMAFIKMDHLELGEAASDFETFLRTFKGNFYVKDACQKVSWCYFLEGNKSAAERARQVLLKRGNTISDADKQAQREAKSGTYPNTLLLKARLLNDGGYNKEALEMLVGKTTTDFAKPEEKLEFNYRVARIYDDLGRDTEAIVAYHAAIASGKNRTEYFAARAALQTGAIYERRGNKEEAIKYYQQCLDMDDHDYKDSIDQKAKAGIARCKGE